MPSGDESDLHKADFDPIYDQPDPRAYHSTLAKFDYGIPEYGARAFDRLLRGRPSGIDTGPPTVLDVCCSYGTVTALLNTDLTMDEVSRHYTNERTAQLSDEELIVADQELLRTRRRHDPVRAFGLDVAKNAVEYAVEIGALDAGAVENLETDEPSPRLRDLLSEVDLITTTGGIGYVTERTFEHLLRHAPPTVWVAAFCLRTYDYRSIQDTLDTHGLVTERAQGTVRQRRFASPAERDWAIASVRENGFDPSGLEDQDYYHAQLYVSRPAGDVADKPLDELIPNL